MRRRRSTAATDPGPEPDLHGGRVHVPRSRGALSGFVLVVLGLWGALIPFVGPAFSFGLRPDATWHWNSARGWLELLPGIVAVVGGILLLLSTNRVVAILGGWLGVAAGAWFAVGHDVAAWFHIGSPGTPLGNGNGIRAVEAITLFTGLGAVMIYFGAAGIGRVSVRSLRDITAAQRREQRAVEGRDSLYQQGHRDGVQSVLAEHEGRRADDARLHESPGPDNQPYPTAAPLAEGYRSEPPPRAAPPS